MNNYIGLFIISLQLCYYATSCVNKKTSILQKQTEIINKIYKDPKSENLLYEYYNDSIIKHVLCFNNDNNLVGTQVRFNEKGELEHTGFVNENGVKCADEAIYYKNNTLTHAFWNLDDKIIFKAVFDSSGQFVSYEGTPYLIEYSNQYKVKDTVYIYIAAPLIYDHITEVKIKEKTHQNLTLNYINETKQMMYKLLFYEPKKLEFTISIHIKKNGKDIISDSTNINIDIVK